MTLFTCVASIGGGAGPSWGLDFFTLWRRPEIPFRLEPGYWTDYHSLQLAQGRRSEEILRVQCVGRTDSGAWIFELLPLVEDESDGSLAPRAGEGVRLLLAADLPQRQGLLVDHVEEVIRWQDGRPQELAADEWRNDPLVAASLANEFTPGAAVWQPETTRVVEGRDLRCQQLLWTVVDSTAVALPHGQLRQWTRHEVTAAINETVPLFGLVFVAERRRAESHLDPPSRRFPDPPPEVKVHTLELVGFGTDARPWLEPATASRSLD